MRNSHAPDSPVGGGIQAGGPPAPSDAGAWDQGELIPGSAKELTSASFTVFSECGANVARRVHPREVIRGVPGAVQH
jgi:hypothetical protein